MERKTRLNELCEEIHKVQVDKGFYEEKREMGTLLMLIVSELSEALEADRKNRYAKDKIGHINISDANFVSEFEENIKDTFEDEIADAVIRIFDLCGYLNIDLDRHVLMKLKYNESRPKKHGKKY